MKKSALEQFIGKYSLGGAADSVLWSVSKKELQTKFIGDDKNVMGMVSTTEAAFDKKGEYGIFDTVNLRSMMAVLDDDVKLSVTEASGNAINIQLRDKTTKVTFVLCDKSIIPPVPTLAQTPNWDVVIPIDKSFSDRFIKGKSGLTDSDTFTVLSEDGKTRVVLGYSDTVNRNQISLDVETEGGNEVPRAINFSAIYMKEILAANKEAEGGTLSVSDEGLAHVTFTVAGFEVDYYLVEITPS